MTSECKTTEEYALHYRSSTMISVGSFKSANVLCDAKLVIGVQEIPVHKLILASRSKYFQDLFCGSKSDSPDGRVTLKDIDFKAAKQCVDFVYSGNITVTQNSVEELLKAACRMKLDELCKWFYAFLESRIDGRTCLNTRRLAITYKNSKLEEVTDDYAVMHFKDISITEDFKNLDKDYLTNLITTHEVQSLSPAVIYESIVAWVKHDVKDRDAHFPELLGYVKLHKLSPEYLKETVQKENLVKESKVCLEMLVNVLFGQISHSPTSPETTRKQSSSENGDMNGVRHEKKSSSKSVCANALIIFDENVHALKAYKPSTGQWLQMQSFPKDIGPFASAVLDKYIFLLARGNQSLYRLEYSLKSATLTQVTGKIVNDSCLLQLVVQDGYIFILGDVSATRRNTSQSGVIRYGPSANTWEYLASLKTPRRGHSVAGVNGSLYCIGGSNGRQDLTSVEKLDPTVGSWANVAPLHHIRYEATAMEFNKKIFVMGGGKFMDLGAGGRYVRSDGEIYDPFTNQWTMVTNVKFPRNIRGACSVDGCIVAIASDDSGKSGKGGLHNIVMINLETSQTAVIAKGSKIKPNCIAILAR